MTKSPFLTSRTCSNLQLNYRIVEDSEEESPIVAEYDRPLPIVDDGLGNSSYLVDLGDGRALALDPSRHPADYLQRAEQRGLTIAYTVETHLHADFVSGSRELAAVGAQVVAPMAAGLEYPACGL